MEHTTVVVQALTTRGGSSEHNFHALVAKGNTILESALYECADLIGFKGIQRMDFVNSGMDSDIMVIVFDIITTHYKLAVQTCPAEKKKGISEKSKAGMLRALIYAVHKEQREVYHRIINEILKVLNTTSLENPVNEVARLVLAKTGSIKKIDDFLVIERIGGTDADPTHRAVFDFDGHSAEATVTGSKGKAKKEVLRNWFASYKQYYKHAA